MFAHYWVLVTEIKVEGVCDGCLLSFVSGKATCVKNVSKSLMATTLFIALNNNIGMKVFSEIPLSSFITIFQHDRFTSSSSFLVCVYVKTRRAILVDKVYIQCKLTLL